MRLFFWLLGLAMLTGEVWGQVGRPTTSMAAPATSVADDAWQPVGADSAWGTPATARPRPRSRNLVGMGARATDSTRRAFVARAGVRRQFGQFYRDSARQWLVLSTTFGDAERELRWRWVACPAFDSASFRDEFPYWHDRWQVMYACLLCHRQEVRPVDGADPATFHGLGFASLGVDARRVFSADAVLPGVDPATLRVYTWDGQRSFGPDAYGGAWVLSSRGGYSPQGEYLTARQVRQFRPPAGYQLAYRASAAPPAATGARRRHRRPAGKRK